MNIAFVSECYPSPANPQYCVFLEQQAMALQQLSHHVVVIKLQRGNGPEVVCNFHGIEVRCINLPSKRIDRLCCNIEFRLKEKEINWREFDIVSIHIVSLYITEAIVSECKDSNVPSVVHYHGLNVWHDYYEHIDIYHRLQKAIENRRKLKMLKNASAIVGVSKSVCDIVQERLHQDNVYTVYNGVDTSLFYPTTKIIDGVFTILCVANLLPIKGHQYLIQAVRKLIDEGYQIRLDLVGVGLYENNLRQLVKKLDLSEKVIFYGSKLYTEVAEMMKTADMFIMPSYYDSFGCVYVEAMSTGTVTCGCNVYGPKEIIEDGVSGLLVKPKNVDSIVEAVKMVIENPDFRKKLEQNAIKRATRFSWHQSAIDLLEVYQKVV